MIYKPEKFILEELVYPDIFKEYETKGKLHRLWGLLDTDMLKTCDRIRFFIDTGVKINDWKWGGVFKESGLRPSGTSTGASLSQHKYGRAGDLKFNGNGWTPEKLREYMKKIGCFEAGFRDRTDEEAKPFLLITRIEWVTYPNLPDKKMSWFHFDTSNTGNEDGSIQIIWLKDRRKA